MVTWIVDLIVEIEKVQFKNIFQSCGAGVNLDMKYKKKKRMVNESQILKD